MTARVVRAGYYWPTLRANCAEWVKRFDECQRYSNLGHAPPTELHNMLSLWPFTMWGMDILGKFSTTKG